MAERRHGSRIDRLRAEKHPPDHCPQKQPVPEYRHKFRPTRPQPVNRLLNAPDEIGDRFGAVAVYVTRVASCPIRLNERHSVVGGRIHVARRRQISKLLNLPLLLPGRGKTLDRRLGALLRSDVWRSDDERRRLRKRISQIRSLLDPSSREWNRVRPRSGQTCIPYTFRMPDQPNVFRVPFHHCAYAPHSLQGNEAHTVLQSLGYFPSEPPPLFAVAFFAPFKSTTYSSQPIIMSSYVGSPQRMSTFGFGLNLFFAELS